MNPFLILRPGSGQVLDFRFWIGESKSKIIFCLPLGAMLFMLCATVEAQQPTKVCRIGIPLGNPALTYKSRIDAFVQGLRELGYVEGKNIVLEYRYGEGKRAGSAEYIAELVRLKVDVIVTTGSASHHAARKATSTIPIVMANAVDPVRDGFVASLARPGGNMTGLANMHTELFAKRTEVFKEIVPKASRVAVLYDGANPENPRKFKELQVAAQSLGVTLQSLDVRVADDFESAFRSASRERAEALRLFGDLLTNSNRKMIVDLATKYRLPAMYAERVWVDAGGLMSYAPSLPDLYRRAANYVDKICKGAKPADLPVQQPMKFELVINLKAAEQIGLTIPREVLRWADEVIR